MTKSVNEIIAQRKAISHDTRYIGPLYLDKPAFKKGILIGNAQLIELEKIKPKEIKKEIESMEKDIFKIMWNKGINRETFSYYLGLISAYGNYYSRGEMLK